MQIRKERADKGYELVLSPKETDELEEYMHETEIITGGKPVKRSNPEFKDRQLELGLKYLKGQIKLADRVRTRVGEDDDE